MKPLLLRYHFILIGCALVSCDSASQDSPPAQAESKAFPKVAKEAFELWLRQRSRLTNDGVQIVCSGLRLEIHYTRAGVTEPQSFVAYTGNVIEFTEFNWNAEPLDLTPDLTLNDISEAYVVRFTAKAGRLKGSEESSEWSEWYFVGDYHPMSKIHIIKKKDKWIIDSSVGTSLVTNPAVGEYYINMWERVAILNE